MFQTYRKVPEDVFEAIKKEYPKCRYSFFGKKIITPIKKCCFIFNRYETLVWWDGSYSGTINAKKENVAEIISQLGLVVYLHVQSKTN